MYWTHLLLLIAALIHNGALAQNKTESNSRQKRLFSIFNIVSFRNDPCTTTGAGNLGGTCLDSTACSSKGGTASGNCASGFGVCCLFIVKGSCSAAQSISQNCTYIRNNGYPAADTTVSETCTYNFDRINNNLCQIRLDFRALTTEAATTGICGTAADAISVTSPFSSNDNGFPPVVCGTLTWQHMYFETGTSGTNAGALAIAKGSGAGNRVYDIKVTYYSCDNVAKAPEGCTQYFTGPSGSFQSFNFANGQLLSSQSYRSCFRQEMGFCRIELRPSITETPNPFFLSGPDSALAAVVGCQALSYITFPSTVVGSYCGGYLNSLGGATSSAPQVSSPGAPFEVGVRSVATTNGGKTGFNLDFTQIPCA
ncbi:uncharacterized protein LOC131885795 isoform X2 [Tigriopus californicus]|uniref:uncharacterized protein LOC131885795 isoform X2 n=1 Tax=Tigriopus californicus TaxID=6832 RepID=UPI0027DAAD4B|nr:uncharacterized protein LOC131885795 isoform X2 [Tigriopus californicus]